jgi:manganese/iron transport system permease protein
MDWFIAPFEVGFVARALVGGLLVSGICALAGTWVVLRGTAFLGDAMSHGMLPGVALASLFGGSLLLGAALSAVAMALGVTALTRSRRISQDTGIGLLFVGMLAAGVIIVSRSQSFAVDLTGFLFGDVLAVRPGDLAVLAGALAVAAVVAAAGHRAFVALAFDPRVAATLGLRPRLAHAAMLGLMTLAITASFHVVGTLLVFGLLIAPPAAMALWARRIPVVMAGAAVLGGLATAVGLLVSWHAQTAAGATIAATAVGFFFLSAAGAHLRDRRPAAARVPADAGGEAGAPRPSALSGAAAEHHVRGDGSGLAAPVASASTRREGDHVPADMPVSPQAGTRDGRGGALNSTGVPRSSTTVGRDGRPGPDARGEARVASGLRPEGVPTADSGRLGPAPADAGGAAAPAAGGASSPGLREGSGVAAGADPVDSPASADSGSPASGGPGSPADSGGAGAPAGTPRTPGTAAGIPGAAVPSADDEYEDAR